MTNTDDGGEPDEQPADSTASSIAPVASDDPASPAESVDPAESDDPAEPDSPTEQAEPAEPAEQVEQADVEDAEVEPPAPEYQRFDCTTGSASELFRAADAARQAVARGQCIVMPTDTVYGIGADAFSSDAVQRLLDAKSRGRDMPPPVLIADSSLVRVLAVDVPQAAKDLIARHWPGPLTVICRAQPSLRLDLGETDGTIALRVPDHELAREILRQTGPMAVSSANRSGQPAAVTCDEAVEQLGESVSVYLDGGRLGAADASPSTIVDFSQDDTGGVLRHGALSLELLRETCPDLEDFVAPAPVPEDQTEDDTPAEDQTEDDTPAEDDTSAEDDSSAEGRAGRETSSEA